MKNVFDITDFGAVGDGFFDCTESVQAALDADACIAQGTVLSCTGDGSLCSPNHMLFNPPKHPGLQLSIFGSQPFA